MKRMILPLLIVLTSAPLVHAQLLPGEPRRYVRFAIDKEFEKNLKERLLMENQLGPLKDLVKKFADDPSKFPVDPDKLKDFDPKKKKALEDWVASDRDLQDSLRDWLKQNKNGKDPKKSTPFQKDLEKILDNAQAKNAKVEASKPAAVDPGELDEGDGDTIGKMTERAMKEAENTRFGDWLRDSPAWNRAFKDLYAQMDDPGTSEGKLNFWQEKLSNLEDGPWNLGEGTWDRLKEMGRPDLSRLKGTLPKGVPGPIVPVPGVPDFSGPSLPIMSTGVTWLLLIALFVLVSWQALRWRRRRAVAAAVLARLGPWPVRPDRIATRAELVLAYNYLALLTLGVYVQSWNHQAIARRWIEAAPQHGAATLALANLYEQARYTDGADALGEAQRELARRSIVQLKEAL